MLLALALAFGLGTAPAQPADDALELAKIYHSRYPLIDGHNDLPWSLRRRADSSFDEFDIRHRHDTGQTDIPRLKEGGVGAQFWGTGRRKWLEPVPRR